MLYAIISQDVENSLQDRLAARPKHLERLTALQDQGRLILAGPHPAIDSNDLLIFVIVVVVFIISLPYYLVILIKKVPYFKRIVS